MDGFADGVKYYNEEKGKNVKVLGWDKAKQDGSFTGDFEKQDKGKQFTQDFVDQGADIVLPVAGPVGQGAARPCRQPRQPARTSSSSGSTPTASSRAPDYKDIMLSSVMKQMGEAVETVVKAGQGRPVHQQAATSAPSRTTASSLPRSTTWIPRFRPN